MTNEDNRPDVRAKTTQLQGRSDKRTTHGRANVSDFEEQANAGSAAEEIASKHDANDVAMTTGAGEDCRDQLDRERMYLLLDDAKRGLADIESGRVQGADAAISHLQQQREAAASGKAAKKRC